MATTRPSLNALRAFEATARLRSMSAAADELSVTHGAVSRHVRMLEDMLGVALLVRGPQASVPTTEGARLAAGLAAGFRTIDASIEQLKPGPLTLSCSTSIMMYWLLPRIGRFHERHPEVELRFDMNSGQFDPVRDRIGLAIRNTRIEPPPGVVVKPLAVERIGLVCSPDYLREVRLESFDDLARCTRLLPNTRQEAWEEWAESAGWAPLPPPPMQSYDHFYLMIQAAICGLGIAPVPRLLVLDDLRSGKLVAPFGFVAGPQQLVLWLPMHVDEPADARALRQWLVEELEHTEREADFGFSPPMTAGSDTR
jgi:LysR family transcriptional regulator, glycine cleavage system transcriptional activator